MRSKRSRCSEAGSLDNVSSPSSDRRTSRRTSLDTSAGGNSINVAAVATVAQDAPSTAWAEGGAGRSLQTDSPPPITISTKLRALRKRGPKHPLTLKVPKRSITGKRSRCSEDSLDLSPASSGRESVRFLADKENKKAEAPDSGAIEQRKLKFLKAKRAQDATSIYKLREELDQITQQQVVLENQMKQLETSNDGGEEDLLEEMERELAVKKERNAEIRSKLEWLDKSLKAAVIELLDHSEEGAVENVVKNEQKKRNSEMQRLAVEAQLEGFDSNWTGRQRKKRRKNEAAMARVRDWLTTADAAPPDSTAAMNLAATNATACIKTKALATAAAIDSGAPVEAYEAG